MIGKPGCSCFGNDVRDEIIAPLHQACFLPNNTGSNCLHTALKLSFSSLNEELTDIVCPLKTDQSLLLQLQYSVPGFSPILKLLSFEFKGTANNGFN